MIWSYSACCCCYCLRSFVVAWRDSLRFGQRYFRIEENWKKTQQKKNEKWKENRTQTVPKIDYIVSQLQLSFPDVRIRHRTLSPRLIRGIQFPNSVHRSNEIIFVWMCGCVLRISNWIGRHDRQALQQCDDVTVWHKQPHRVWLTSARTTNDMNMTIK